MGSKRAIILLCASVAVFTFYGTWGCIKGERDETLFKIKTEPADLLDGRVGEAYVFKFESEGGTYPHTWSIEEGGAVLPPELYLSTTGNMTGTPTTAGVYSFTVVLTDSDNDPRSVTENFTLTILAADDVVITTSALAPGYVDQAYGPALLSATGGTTTSYTWDIAGGGLPPGIILQSGVISGTPTLDGTYDFTVGVTDSDTPSHYATKDLSMVVYPAASLTVTTTSLADAVANEAYAQTLAASGGVVPYTWDLEAQSSPLPDGFYLSGSGHLTGTPTTAGSYSFSVEVVDSDVVPSSATASLTLSVLSAGPLSITTPNPLPPGTMGAAYAESLQANGGKAPYTWALEEKSAPLPDGLFLSEGGHITGIPTTVGSYSFSVKVTDSDINPHSTTMIFELTIN